MGVGQPGVQREDRHLDQEGQREGPEAVELLGGRKNHPVPLEQVEGVDPRDLVEAQVHVEDGHQHEHRAHHGVEHELDGRVDPPLAAPDADEQIHGYQHQLPEHVEEHHVHGHEGAEHARLEDQHRGDKLFVPLLDRPAGAEDGDGGEECGEQHQEDGDAVHAHVELDPQRFDPMELDSELHVGGLAVELVQQHQGDQEDESGCHNPEVADELGLLLGQKEHERGGQNGEEYDSSKYHDVTSSPS